MQKSTIKRLCFVLTLYLIFTGLFAQDIYLPVSSRNKEAKELYKKAWFAFVNLDFTTSQKLSQEALKADPNFFMARYISLFDFKEVDSKPIAEKLIAHKGKLNKTEKILQEVINNYYGDTKAPGLPTWNKLVELHPNNVFVNNWLAYLTINEANNPQKAKDILIKAIAHAPNWGPYYNMLGYVFLDLKQYPDAEKAFDKYIELAPQYANPYDSKGDYFMAVKNYKEAHKCFTKAFEIDNNILFSEKKAKTAKHLHKCELKKPEVKEANDALLKHFVNKELKEHYSYYIKNGSFRYIWNSKANFSMQEVKDIHAKNFEKWASFSIETSDEIINMLEPHLAIATQNFVLSIKNNDGTETKMAGNYSTYWKKIDDKWKLLQFIDMSHEVK